MARSNDGLKPELGLLDATTINIGTMVASGIFLVPATIAAGFSGVFPTILVWIVGAVVSLFGALCVAELGAAMPRAGGQFVYLTRIYGPVWGYLYGWGSSVIINPASIAAIAVGFATYLDYFFANRLGAPLGDAGIKITAIASIGVLTLINCFGVKLGAITQNVLTITKVAAVVGIIAICFLLPGGSIANLQPFWPAESVGRLVGPFGVAMVLVLFAYDGWIEITYVGSEMKHPERHLAPSVVLATLVVATLYVAASLAFTWVLGHQGVATSTRVASDAATVVLGAAGATVITSTILVSTLGANNGIVFTAARIPYAMALDGRFFGWAGKLNDRYAVPIHAMVAQGIWSSLLALSGRYDQLATYVVFVSFLFYGMSAAGVILLRRREPALPRPYRTWGYPVTPVLFTLFAGFLIFKTVQDQARDAAVGALLLGVGLVFYYGLGWYRRKP